MADVLNGSFTYSTPLSCAVAYVIRGIDDNLAPLFITVIVETHCRSMLGHNLVRCQPRQKLTNEEDGNRQYSQVVNLTESQNEIRDKIDRRHEINQSEQWQHHFEQDRDPWISIEPQCQPYVVDETGVNLAASHLVVPLFASDNRRHPSHVLDRREYR